MTQEYYVLEYYDGEWNPVTAGKWSSHIIEFPKQSEAEQFFSEKANDYDKRFDFRVVKVTERITKEITKLFAPAPLPPSPDPQSSPSA